MANDDFEMVAICIYCHDFDFNATIFLATNHFPSSDILHPFQVIRLPSTAHIHIDINEFRHTYIYMNVGNARKSYNMKRRKYHLTRLQLS